MRCATRVIRRGPCDGPVRGALAIGVVASAVLVLIAPFPGGTARAQARPAPTESTERDIVDQTNAFRAHNDLAPTAANAILAAEARAFAAFLAETPAFSHTADGRSPSDRAEAAGYRACVLEENIARIEGFARQGGRLDPSLGSLATQFVTGWENSPGHRHNMLDPTVTETGVGVASAHDGDAYAAVQVFGRPDSLRFDFRVDNRTEAAVGVTYDGQTRRLRPGGGIVYTTCTPGVVTFDRRISGLAMLRPERDRVYRLHQVPGSGVQIEVLGEDPSAASGGPVRHP